MGKSTASCFKIITCGGDSVDHDDLQTPESKVSSGRSGWSFRKRSARHRVLRNTVISEAASSADKDSTAANFHVQHNLTVPEKDKLSAEMDSNLSDIIADKEDVYGADATSPDESSIILIQASIRGYLARRVLLKQKNVIKLQAAVRGHLVRCHAVGTLRCVQAIVKMQALVRLRQAHRLVEGSGDFEKLKKNSAKDNHNPTVLRSKREAKPIDTYTYASIEKLLSNKFARQLMESTPRTKSINIKCDPSKSDPVWKWLERWMPASSLSNEEPDESASAPEQHEKENIGYSSAETSENGENLITYDADKLDIRSCLSIPPSTSHPHLQNMEESNSRYDITESGAVGMKETDLIPKVDAKSFPFKDETANGQDIPDVQNISIEHPETEGIRFSRKTSNPSFIAAQSKFEELSSEKLTTLSSYYPGVESSFDNVSAPTYPPFRSKEIGSNVNSISNASAIQIAVSECGTELSISSTLDSPDMSDGGVNDLDQELKILDVADHPTANSSTSGTGLSYTNINQLEKHGSVHSAAHECVDSTIVSDSSPLEKKLEADEISDLQVEMGSEASHLVYKSSPEASPRSLTALPESQVTSSSQVSLNPKKSIGEKSNSSLKKRSLSADKKEQLQKKHKTGKRRNSFGSAKVDRADQEPRDSSSSSSLPSYMLATESARAKALSNGSPRSSPDVQDKDIFIKNRPSLPGTNGRLGSPRIHRSPSQAQQHAKGNRIHSPQERKWRR